MDQLLLPAHVEEGGSETLFTIITIYVIVINEQC